MSVSPTVTLEEVEEEDSEDLSNMTPVNQVQRQSNSTANFGYLSLADSLLI
jgi:hypothetical protein